jgi:hypothetical protein
VSRPAPPATLTVVVPTPDPIEARLVVRTEDGLYDVDLAAGSATLRGMIDGAPMSAGRTSVLLSTEFGPRILTDDGRIVPTTRVVVPAGELGWWDLLQTPGSVSVMDLAGQFTRFELPSEFARAVGAAGTRVVATGGGRTLVIDMAQPDAPPVPIDGEPVRVNVAGVALVERCDAALTCRLVSVDLTTGADLHSFGTTRWDAEAISPDGRWLIDCASGSCVAEDGVNTIDLGRVKVMQPFAWSPDGQWMFFTDLDQQLRAWRVGTNPTYPVRLGGQPIVSAAVVPDA